MQQRIHILSTVNASAISKTGGMYTINGVCGAVDDIVMNAMLYPGDQLAAGIATMEGKPAPAGHPKDVNGRYISALSGDALLSSYAGAVCVNARHEGGRSVVDVRVNEAQAMAHPDGKKLVERLESAMNGSNIEPIHVSTGLVCEAISANGESKGKKYSRIATNIKYDHLAFLLNEQGAGTPADGVGMFLNAAGEELPVDVVTVNLDDIEPEDRRSKGFMRWIMGMLGNSNDLSFDQITSGLYKSLASEKAWIQEVFDRYAVWSDGDGKMFRQDYTVSSDGSVAFVGEPVEVYRQVEYKPVINSQEIDKVKDLILAALNKAGISVEGKDDAALLEAYNALTVKPVEEKLIAANSKLAEIEVNAKAAEQAEVDALAKALAVNSVLTADDFAKMGLARLKELSANKGAAPVVPAGGQSKAPSMAGYDINAVLNEGDQK